jgi:hypothetical protein
VCPRRQGLALLCGPSTSPLDAAMRTVLFFVVGLLLLAACLILGRRFLAPYPSLTLVAAPTTKAELILALRQFAALRPTDKASMRVAAKEAAALALHVQKHLKGMDVPEIVWHFLSDVDTRWKDPKYAAVQLAQLESVLVQWSHGGGV